MPSEFGEPWRQLVAGLAKPTRAMIIRDPAEFPDSEDQAYITPAEIERIFACIDACAGVPTEMLKPGMLATMITVDVDGVHLYPGNRTEKADMDRRDIEREIEEYVREKGLMIVFKFSRKCDVCGNEVPVESETDVPQCWIHGIIQDISDKQREFDICSKHTVLATNDGEKLEIASGHQVDQDNTRHRSIWFTKKPGSR